MPPELFSLKQGSADEVQEMGPLVSAVLARTPADGVDLALAWVNGIRASSGLELLPQRSLGLLGPASWYTYNAVVGFNADLPRGILTLAPNLPVKMKSLTTPLFAPTFWASLEYRVTLTSARLTFRLDRLMPAQPVRKVAKEQVSASEAPAAGLILKEVVLPQRPERVTTEITTSLGQAPLLGKFTRRDDGQLIFTFATPLSMTVGQSLSFLLR